MKIRAGGMCWVVGVSLVALAALGFSVSVTATGMEASAAIVVTTTADELINDGNCSLREAIQAANTHTVVDACGDGGFETIELPSGVYALTLAGPNEDDNATGDLDIKGNVTVQGTGTSVPVVDGNQLDRVLQVHPGVTVAVTGVTIRNGRAPNGTSNGGSGGDGGGIANAGTLTLSGCKISDDRAGNGANGTEQSINGGDAGNGGGIANAGTLTLSGCDIGGNQAGNGGDGYPGQVGWGGGGSGGDAGRGGGAFNTGTLILEGSTVRDNVSGAGGSVIASLASGDAGHGGGIYNAGMLVVKGSTIRGNRTATGGYVDSPPFQVGGSGGAGGGIYNAGSLTLDGSSVHGNRTADGDSSRGGGHYGAGGHGGHGGGIYNANTLGWSNSTVSGNVAGNGGESDMGPGYGGDGGGVHNAGTLTIDNGTVSANIAGGGGGGVYSSAGTLEIRNTILAGNVSAYAGPDCAGILTSAGYNLLREASGCTMAGDTTSNIVGVDPLLHSLADNGGPTWTHALAPGSVAVDAGSCTSIGGAAITVDQRGVGRPQGLTCDIGAYEAPVFPKVYLPVVLR